MPEWVYEEGIGENRAILVQNHRILEAAIEVHGEPRVGAVVTGRYQGPIEARRGGWVRDGDRWVLMRDPPSSLTKGQRVNVEIIREEILESGHSKSLVGRITDDASRQGPSLVERIGTHQQQAVIGPDPFEEAGWSDLVEEALSGEVFFDGGQLRISLTPAMTLIDVDGWLAPAELAVAGARAAGEAVRRHGITGSIGIDLPTVASKTTRQKAAEALDATVPQPFERTAVNGFGFLQLIRKRERQSLPELLQNDSTRAAARALLRRAERVPGLGARRLTGAPEVIAYLESHPEWLVELRRRVGAEVKLQADARATTWGIHAQAVQS